MITRFLKKKKKKLIEIYNLILFDRIVLNLHETYNMMHVECIYSFAILKSVVYLETVIKMEEESMRSFKKINQMFKIKYSIYKIILISKLFTFDGYYEDMTIFLLFKKVNCY